jgi:hypothetical protein
MPCTQVSEESPTAHRCAATGWPPPTSCLTTFWPTPPSRAPSLATLPACATRWAHCSIPLGSTIWRKQQRAVCSVSSDDQAIRACHHCEAGCCSPCCRHSCLHCRAMRTALLHGALWTWISSLVIVPSDWCCHCAVQPTDFFAVNARGYVLDFWAFGLILVLSLLLCWGIKETKTFNNGAPLAVAVCRCGCLGAAELRGGSGRAVMQPPPQAESCYSEATCDVEAKCSAKEMITITSIITWHCSGDGASRRRRSLHRHRGADAGQGQQLHSGRVRTNSLLLCTCACHCVLHPVADDYAVADDHGHAD